MSLVYKILKFYFSRCQRWNRSEKCRQTGLFPTFNDSKISCINVTDPKWTCIEKSHRGRLTSYRKNKLKLKSRTAKGRRKRDHGSTNWHLIRQPKLLTCITQTQIHHGPTLIRKSHIKNHPASKQTQPAWSSMGKLIKWNLWS